MKRLLIVGLLALFPALATAQTPVVSEQTTIAGNALSLLPDTNSGIVEVIAHGERDQSGHIPVVVRNNTDEPVVNVVAQVSVRDGSGKLIGVGETMSNHALKPYLLNPGDVAIGFIRLDDEMPADAEYTYSAVADQPGGFLDGLNIDVEFREVNWLPDRIVGEFINPTDQPLSSTYLMVTCFDADGTPLLSDVSSIDLTVAVGDTALFQMGGVFGDLSVCERFLIAGTAHPQR